MKFGYIVLAALLTSCVQNEIIPVSGKSDMCFGSLSKTWYSFGKCYCWCFSVATRFCLETFFG